MVSSSGPCSTTLRMPRHRWGHVSGFILDTLFLCGGSTQLDGALAANNTCDSYSLPTQTWAAMENMAAARHGAAATTLLGKFYVLGGFNGMEALRSVEVYDPESKRWAAGVDMP